jgi:folate-binding protein YgfZ
MDRTLRETQLRSGAVINGERGVALHFGDARAELAAALDACALIDRSVLGRIVATGPDFLDLLQRLGTGDVRALATGDGRPTILTTAKGRMVERAFVHALGVPGVLAVVGPAAAPPALAHLARYTFAEKTGLEDRTGTTCQLALVGPRAQAALGSAGFERPEPFGSKAVDYEGSPVWILGEDGLTGDGYSVVAPLDLGPSLWHGLQLAVLKEGGRAAGDQAAEAWRVLRGIPASGHEITEDANPLEAGLRDSVSFAKGCYVGQEVVARLNTYDKVARTLVGLTFPTAASTPAIGATLFFQDEAVGRVTTAIASPDRPEPIALAYLKRRVAEPGLELAVGAPDSTLRARMVRLPFPR